MIDAYTKTILTVIATALCAIAVHMFVGPASAQLAGSNCGDTTLNACDVEVDNSTLDVNVMTMP
jgi:hypothetical protein